MKRKFIAYLLVICLTITSCIGLAPQAFAESATDGNTDIGIETEIPMEPTDPADPELPDEPSEPSDPSEPENPENPVEPEIPSDPDDPADPELPAEPELIISAWDEDGFYHDENGEVVKGVCRTVDGKLYKFDKDGYSKLHTGWFGNKYYKAGKLYTGWLNYKYYKAGKLYTGWLKNKYYKNGKVHTGVAVNKKGVPYYYVKGVKNSKIKYMYKERCYVNGKLYTGIRKINKGVFYYNKGVKSKTKIYTYNGKKYKNGRVYSGLYKSYYYNNGKKVTGYKDKVKKVKTGEIHYFKKDGSVYRGTGWKRIDGKRYYFKSGRAYKGWKYIGDYKYYFHKKTGSLCQDLITCQGEKWKKADLKIKVNRQKNCVTIYAKDGNNGYIIPVKAMTCSVGKAETPTIKGTYTLKNKSGRIYRWHKLGGPDMGGYVYGQYAVRIHRGYMFHSVTYREPDKYTFIASTYNNLGGPASHGCVRLQVKDAKLIYEIVKYRDTKVQIYDSDYTGPFDKPVLKKIPASQNYEPTDPSV